MNKLKVILGIMFVAMLSLSVISCRETGDKSNDDMEMEMDHDNMDADQHGGMQHDEMENGQYKGKEMAMNLKFKEQGTNDIFQHYTHIKTALVNGDVEEAQNGGELLNKAFGTTNADAKSLAIQINQSDNIEAQRKAFSLLSVEMEEIIRGSMSSGEVYKQFCPMAFNNQGAYWLSKNKEINNPYFGQKMLKCGSTKEVIQ